MNKFPTFSVAAMIREEPFIVDKFIEFYRKAGAERIIIYYDAPLSKLNSLDLSDIDIIECNDAFWVEVCGVRPTAWIDSQRIVLQFAANACSSDWLLIVDADEFLIGDRPIRALLDEVPRNIDALRIRNAEAIWGPGDDIREPYGCTHFRTIVPGRLAPYILRLVYGSNTHLFGRGTLGHSKGKHFVRPGASATVTEHDSYINDLPIGRWAHDILPEADNFLVAHFDAISFERWCEKWRRRFIAEPTKHDNMGVKRKSQMSLAEALITTDDDQAWAFFCQLYGINHWQKSVLTVAKALSVHRVFK